MTWNELRCASPLGISLSHKKLAVHGGSLGRIMWDDEKQHQLNIHTTAKKHFTDQQLNKPTILWDTVKRDSSYSLNDKQPINSLHPDPLQLTRLLIKTCASLKGFTFICSELSFLTSLLLAPSPRNGFCLAAPWNRSLGKHFEPTSRIGSPSQNWPKTWTPPYKRRPILLTFN